MESKTRYGVKLDQTNWDFFVAFCVREGISTEDEGDWGAWWDCWADGYDTALKETGHYKE